MEKVYFKCKFKADIVLNSKTSTEGKNNPLDYIPGNVFLGIVAKNYNAYADKAFDVFHSSKVRFNDASLLINGKESFKIPFSYFAPKSEDVKKLLCGNSETDDKKIFIHHYLTKEKYDELKENGIQLKQVRNGYINEDGNYLNIASVYQQKSAYDKKTRHSDDGKMFGYNAIKRGTEFLFSVDFDDDINEYLKNQIIDDLIGNQYIGKSKTAQYGKVKIREISTPQGEMYGRTSQQEGNDNKDIIIYAKSNLAFIDENTGMPTAQPKFKNCKILWEKSQIRTRRYTPYNNARKTFDYEKVIIEKGSVFVIKLDEGCDFDDFKKSMENGVGIYKNEGFGQILINPKFLMELNPKFELKEVVAQNTHSVSSSHPSQEGNFFLDKNLIDWLEFKNIEKEKIISLVEYTTEFIKDNPSFKDIKTSQWGQVRSIASGVNTKDELMDKLFREGEGYLVHGVAKEQWVRKVQSFKDGIKDADEPIQFVRFLAKEISRKIKAKGKKGGSND